MKVLNLTQGTPEWDQTRLEHFTASEAAAMMGCSPYMSRDELLKLKATGIAPEVNEHQQRRFDKGHAAEAGARPIAEGIIGEELYPCTAEGDDDRLLASMDGLTMLGDVGFEHKLNGQKVVAQIEAEELADHYKWQMDQQMAVTGAEKVLFMASDGTEENAVWMWYHRDENRIKRLVAGWDQFEDDLCAYQARLENGLIKEPKEAQAEVIADLPAINYRMNGLSLSSNLDEFKAKADALIEKAKQKIESDEDFATAESMVKKFKGAEDKIGSLCDQVLAEVSDIDQFTRDLKQIGESIRQARLATEKQVTARKEAIRIEIVTAAKAKLTDHIDNLQSAIGVRLDVQGDFAGAIKGKKTVASLQSAADDELAKAKIAANEQADTARRNLAAIPADFDFLFADRQQIAFKAPDDFDALVKTRVAEHKEREAKRKAEEEAAAKAAQEQQPAPAVEKSPRTHATAPVTTVSNSVQGDINAESVRKVAINGVIARWNVTPETAIDWLDSIEWKARQSA